MTFRDTVDRLTADFIAAFNRGDAAAAAAAYTDDAIFVNPGPVTVSGRAAVAEAFAAEHASGLRLLGFETVAAEAAGGTGWAIQTFPTSTGPTVIQIALRREEGGVWRIAAETVVG